MNIRLVHITVRELCDGYANHEEEGVFAYGGLLNVRPPYQREFVYDDKKKHAVIDTVSRGFPLNVMYWAKNADGTFEIIDGQQRTLSLCTYVDGDYSCRVFGIDDLRAFYNLPDDHKKRLLDYRLTVYICEGTDSERLDWFRTINIAGERLTDQELRNAVYTGTWVSDAKRYFSKTGCVAFKMGHPYLKGTPIRQDYLETVIDWISSGCVNAYMSAHQHDPNAALLWQYFSAVMQWTKTTFPHYRKEMKGLPWGIWYNDFKDTLLDGDRLEERIVALLMDDDVTRKSGVYEYVLTGNERALSLRAFTAGQLRQAYERQQGICARCGKSFSIDDMEGDHITPWSKGGKTTLDNLQMLCRVCNRVKSDH